VCHAQASPRTSAVSATLNFIRGFASCLGLRCSGTSQTSDASMYSMLRTAPGLTRLEMKGIDLPSGQTKGNQFLALRGAPLRHLVLHVPRFYNSGTGSEEALMSVLADLRQLVSLDMSFPRCAARKAWASTGRQLAAW